MEATSLVAASVLSAITLIGTAFDLAVRPTATAIDVYPVTLAAARQPKPHLTTPEPTRAGRDLALQLAGFATETIEPATTNVVAGPSGRLYRIR